MVRGKDAPKSGVGQRPAAWPIELLDAISDPEAGVPRYRGKPYQYIANALNKLERGDVPKYRIERGQHSAVIFEVVRLYGRMRDTEDATEGAPATQPPLLPADPPAHHSHYDDARPAQRPKRSGRGRFLRTG